ncbi:hypothetical protein BDV97DRAFT_61764 [Delphinella strobiligena]|nr:hypothetical protein BDV97DRAFT_61764 [Delphinella strobiligena]
MAGSMELCSLHTRGLVACYNHMMAFESSIIYTTKSTHDSEFKYTNCSAISGSPARTVEIKDTSLVVKVRGRKTAITCGPTLNLHIMERLAPYLSSSAFDTRFSFVGPAVSNNMITKMRPLLAPMYCDPLWVLGPQGSRPRETRERWKTIGQ